MAGTIICSKSHFNGFRFCFTMLDLPLKYSLDPTVLRDVARHEGALSHLSLRMKALHSEFAKYQAAMLTCRDALKGFDVNIAMLKN
jgi:hypothetical protein